jgi:hypothetical protein
LPAIRKGFTGVDHSSGSSADAGAAIPNPAARANATSHAQIFWSALTVQISLIAMGERIYWRKSNGHRINCQPKHEKI